MDTIKGDVLTKEEMRMRGIHMIATERGGVELRTKESMATIAGWLVDNGFIDEHQTHSANIFMDLRRAYEASMGIKWLALREHILEGLQLTQGQATELYDDIRHQIGIKRAGDIHSIVSMAMLTPFNGMRAEQADVYRIAFDTLSLAMENVKSRKKDIAHPL